MRSPAAVIDHVPEAAPADTAWNVLGGSSTHAAVSVPLRTSTVSSVTLPVVTPPMIAGSFTPVIVCVTVVRVAAVADPSEAVTWTDTVAVCPAFSASWRPVGCQRHVPSPLTVRPVTGSPTRA